MAKVTFSKEFMLDMLESGPIHEDRMVDHRRWAVVHEIVFEHEGRFYRTRYSVGATESQDEGPWEGQDTVECTEVHQVPKTVMVWEPL